MTLNENKDLKEEELSNKIREELILLSNKFTSMSNYLEQIKHIILNDDIVENINNNNKNENISLLRKRKNIPNNKISNNINNKKEEIYEKVENISNSSKSSKSSKIKNIKHNKIHKISNKIRESKEKYESFKKKKINKSHSKMSKIDERYEKNEDSLEEEEEEEEEEYINSEEENSNSSLDEKRVNKTKKSMGRKKKKSKHNQNGIYSKLYPVKIIQNDVISSGYRVYFKCKGISMCFGPYADFNFAFDFRKLMHSQLKMFTEDIPNVMEKIEEFLKRTKEAVDKKQAPVEMVKKYKTINN